MLDFDPVAGSEPPGVVACNPIQSMNFCFLRCAGESVPIARPVLHPLRSVLRVHFLLLLAALITSSIAACSPVREIVYSIPAASAVPSRLSSADGTGYDTDRHVIVISVDGLRPDAIDRFGATTMQRLMRNGNYSLRARTILPSITLPSHTSMLTGVGPEVHGITWNDNLVEEKGRVQLPTILASAREHGLSAAAFVSKGKFNHLLVPGDVDHFVVPEGDGSWAASRTVREVEEYLARNRPNLLFVHLREPDRYGHLFGWMGRIYGWAVRQSDEAVERILASADDAFGPNNYTVILTADHGGSGRRHRTGDLDSQTIPWIVSGRGVAGSGELRDGIRTMDTAATVLWILGLPIPELYQGVPVIEAFERDLLTARGTNAVPATP
jgi:arylsulfatase A-like enzyme